MQFDPATVKHLGLQMYSTLPPVLSELVSNAWDAGASEVRIEIPEGRPVGDSDSIVVTDDGDGMSDQQVREAYLIVGRDRRQSDGTDKRADPPYRKVMGRKGIGKFAGFGVAKQVELETHHAGETSRFAMNFSDLSDPTKRNASFPPLEPTGEISSGTRIILRNLNKYRTRPIPIAQIRKNLARRFSIVDDRFKIYINDKEITPEERDIKALLAKDRNGDRYIWEFDNIEIEPNTGWTVSGWIGALATSSSAQDDVQRGIAIMARGKLVQEPFTFEASVGQQYALAYLVGELHAEFVDEHEDTVSTARNSLVWDTDANAALLTWGREQINTISREWASKRAADNEAALKKNPAYQRYLDQSSAIADPILRGVADKLIRKVVTQNLVDGDEKINQVVDMCVDYLQYDSFKELASLIAESDDINVGQLSGLFRQWQVVEAKEMAKVTAGRVTTIKKLQELIDSNALEVPTLHNFLKEFPWVLDPRWHLVDDEVHYSKLLLQMFPDAELPEEDRRIDFMCVRENDTLVVVEIKRPKSVLSKNELTQIQDYVQYVRSLVEDTTDPEYKVSRVVGYLLGGTIANVDTVRQKVRSLEKDDIWVRQYSGLLTMVKRAHSEFLEKYEQLSLPSEEGAAAVEKELATAETVVPASPQGAPGPESTGQAPNSSSAVVPTPPSIATPATVFGSSRKGSHA